MNIIDRKWIVQDKNILHLCQGDLIKSMSLPGIWPVKTIEGKKRCSICKEEVPDHVLIYV